MEVRRMIDGEEDDKSAALEAVINPLLNAICPRKIDEPKTKIAQLIREVLKDSLGNKKFVDIIDRFLIDGAEKDPADALAKLIVLHDKLGNVIHNIVEEG